MLQCPKCQCDLIIKEHSYVCENHHTYDISKRGYVNLFMANRKMTGDPKEMVKARNRFLIHGYYQNLRDELVDIIQKISPSIIVDAGCGEGYYTNAIYRGTGPKEMYGFDLSKHAVDEACKAHLNITYAVCSVFHMPLKDGYADLVLSVFAPFSEEENLRVLKENGYFIKVGPAAKHLIEMKEILYDDVYENEEKDDVPEGFVLVDKKILDYRILVSDKNDIWALFQMTPYFWKTPREGSMRLKELDELATAVQFSITIWQKKSI